MFFGGIVLSALLGFFSILATQVIHPFNVEIAYPDCERCPRGFQSTKDSMLTLYQQVVAGDSWGLLGVPVVEAHWAGMLLPLVQLVIGIGAMNLILAVVVDRAVEAREHNRSQVAMQRTAEMRAR